MMTIEKAKTLTDQALVKAVERRCKERLHASKVQTASLLGLSKSSWYRYTAADTPILATHTRLLLQALVALSDAQLRQLLSDDQTPVRDEPVADLL